MSSRDSAAQVAHSFNKLLNQSSKRTPKEAEESVKKLRRLILIEGIPSAAVRIVRPTVKDSVAYLLARTVLSGIEYGRSSSGLPSSLRRPFWIMWREDPARFGRRSGMILSGAFIEPNSYVLCTDSSPRTLATDRGFKERVREDMLVRLLDAFVWRNHGMFINSCDP